MFDKNLYNKEYYEKNRNKLFKTVKCECGKYYKHHNKYNHYQSHRHQIIIQQIKELSSLKL